MIPNADQQEALDMIRDWFDSDPDEPFILGGLAGTGKTALLPMLHKSFERTPRIRYVCPTWKAAHVLTRKLRAEEILAAATSIHNLIYNPRGILHDEDCGIWDNPAEGCTKVPKCKQLCWEFDPKDMPQLLVVDEASMVDPRQREDIARLGCPTLYVGDHGQLPPVQGSSIFDDNPLSAKLERIQRQAADSPIIPLSRIVRDGDSSWIQQAAQMGFPVYQTGPLSEHRYDPRAAVPPHSDPETVFITGTNASVDKLNAHTRKILGRGPGPLVRDDLVMVQNNDRRIGIFNGQQGVIKSVEEMPNGRRYIDLAMETGVRYNGQVLIKGIDDIPDRSDIPVIRHSYAVTCHKAQGSEFQNVVVYLTKSRPETPRWLYTAVTRATTNLSIVKTY